MKRRTRKEILADLKQVERDEKCTLAEAAFILVIEAIQNDPRAEFAEMYIRAEHSGKKQSAAVLESLIKEREKRQGKKQA